MTTYFHYLQLFVSIVQNIAGSKDSPPISFCFTVAILALLMFSFSPLMMKIIFFFWYVHTVSIQHVCSVPDIFSTTNFPVQFWI